MHTKKFIVAVVVLVAIVLSALVHLLLQGPQIVIQPISPEEFMSQRPYLGSTFSVGGREVTLENGVHEVESAPGSASKIVTRYFGNNLVKDMNGDGQDDVTFLVTEETGGSGTFFHVVTALKTDGGYVGSNAVFLGDRIAPQAIEPGPNNTVIVNFADRVPGEGFDVEPSHGRSVTILLDPLSGQLSQLVVDYDHETGWEIPQSDGKLKADVFTGTLEEVNTGCFADAECYIVVDGKRVTAIMGWSSDTVGSVQGVDGFGDLESHIGGMVEVYAHNLQNDTYTLYGSEEYYIKLLTSQDSTSGDQSEPDVGVGDEPKPQVVRDGCVVGGCSGQLCGEADAIRDMVTTCEYRAEYACYQVATCERQQSGQCGWTETESLKSCLLQTAPGPVSAY